MVKASNWKTGALGLAPRIISDHARSTSIDNWTLFSLFAIETKDILSRFVGMHLRNLPFAGNDHADFSMDDHDAVGYLSLVTKGGVSLPPYRIMGISILAEGVLRHQRVILSSN